MKNRYIITATDKTRMQTIAARLVGQTLASMTEIEPSVSLSIGGRNIKEYIGNPYGILPFAMSASKEEILNAIKYLEISKYAKIERGDYYGSWRDTHRQRILEGVLNGMTTFNLEVLQ